MPPHIATNAQIPNPRLAPFARLVGDWRTRGTHPALPGTTLHGRASFAWQDGGAFLVWRSEIDHPQFPAGIAIFGSDDAAGTAFIAYFDARGISRKYDVTPEPGGFSMHRADPAFSQRMRLRIDAGGDRIVGTGEMSCDGGAWEPDLSVTYER